MSSWQVKLLLSLAVNAKLGALVLLGLAGWPVIAAVGATVSIVQA